MEPTLPLKGTTSDIIKFIKRLKDSGENIDDTIDAYGTFKIDGYSVGLIDYTKEIFYADAEGESNPRYYTLANKEFKIEKEYEFKTKSDAERFIDIVKGNFEPLLYYSKLGYLVNSIKKKYPHTQRIVNIEGLKLLSQPLKEIDIENDKVKFIDNYKKGNNKERIVEVELVHKWHTFFDDKQALEKFKKRLDAMTG
jgi:hypothetical protein